MGNFDAEILAELKLLNARLGGQTTPDYWTPKTLSQHAHISIRAAERVIRKHGHRIDREWRLTDAKKRKLEEAGPHYLATYR